MENRERRGYSRGLYRAVTMFLRCRLPLSAAPLITYHDPASTNRAIASTFSGAISRGWLMRHHRWGVTIHETPKRVTRSDVIRRKIHRNRRMDTDTFYGCRVRSVVNHVSSWSSISVSGSPPVRITSSTSGWSCDISRCTHGPDRMVLALL